MSTFSCNPETGTCSILGYAIKNPHHATPYAKAEYVIIGAGSAGCAIACRLAEARRKVIIIEFGDSDAVSFIHMPAALSYPMNMPRYD